MEEIGDNDGRNDRQVAKHENPEETKPRHVRTIDRLGMDH